MKLFLFLATLSAFLINVEAYHSAYGSCRCPPGYIGGGGSECQEHVCNIVDVESTCVDTYVNGHQCGWTANVDGLCNCYNHTGVGSQCDDNDGSRGDSWCGTTAELGGDVSQAACIGLSMYKCVWNAAPGCAANERVSTGACVACENNSVNAAGDDPGGADTNCGECADNYRVVGNACVACEGGTSNTAHVTDEINTGGNTTCDTCMGNYRVVENGCDACSAGKTNPAGDENTGDDTTCSELECAVDERVISNECDACDLWKDNAVGDNASGPDTSCDADCAKAKAHLAANCVRNPNTGEYPVGDCTAAAASLSDCGDCLA